MSRRTRRWVLGLFCGILLLMVLLEGICRLEWSLRSEVPFFSANLYFTYPELRALSGEGGKDLGDLDVLLLGGSVLHDDWGSVAQALEEQVTLATRRKVHIYNLARPGHTSLDSRYKYQRLDHRHFDLVLVYHGINELRLNNCPRRVFREDYGHYSWYRLINLLEAHRSWPDLAALYDITYRWFRLQEKLFHPDAYIPKDRPSPERMAFGGEIKTRRPFEANLGRIVETAKERNELVVLMTFAYHLPATYTLERFEAGDLDYGLHSCAVEIWGLPEHVRTGLDAHNRVIRDLGRRYGEKVVLVDQERDMPRGGRYFNDICHLTQWGCGAFAANIVRQVQGMIEPRAVGATDKGSGG